MTDSVQALKHGDEYIVFYKGGPFDGQTDRRISTNGSWDTDLTVIAAVDGKETQVVYGHPEMRRIGEQVQVHYNWKPEASDEFEDPEERGDM
jgi:hypothetical protein